MKCDLGIIAEHLLRVLFDAIREKVSPVGAEILDEDCEGPCLRTALCMLPPYLAMLSAHIWIAGERHATLAVAAPNYQHVLDQALVVVRRVHAHEMRPLLDFEGLAPGQEVKGARRVSSGRGNAQV